VREQRRYLKRDELNTSGRYGCQLPDYSIGIDIAFRLSDLVPDFPISEEMLEGEARWAGLWSNELRAEVESFVFMMQLGLCICEAA
jgi:hypothetical protein